VPSHEFRLDYTACRDLLRRRLAEPAPGRIQLPTGTAARRLGIPALDWKRFLLEGPPKPG